GASHYIVGGPARRFIYQYESRVSIGHELFLVWVFVTGIGCRIALGRDFSIPCFGCPKYFFKLSRGCWHGMWDKFQGWSQPGSERSAHLAAQKATVFVHCLVRCSNGLIIAINCVVHGCLLQIISDTSLGNSDVIDAVVFDGFLQGFCED